MRRRLGKLSLSLFTAGSKTCGLLLVFAAMSSIALARSRSSPTPEIDPGSAVSALTLLAGGVWLLMDRRRK